MTTELMILAEAASAIRGNLHVAFAAVGSAIGVGIIGAKACEAVGRNPGAATPILVQSILAMALAEGVIFFSIFLANNSQ